MFKNKKAARMISLSLMVVMMVTIMQFGLPVSAAEHTVATSYSNLEHSFLNIARHSSPTINCGQPWAERQVHYPETIVDPSDSSKLIQFYGGGNVSKYNYSIGRATATVADPYTWTEYGSNPVVGPGTSCHSGAPVVGPNYVFYNTSESKYWMYYTDYINMSMYLATSTDGFSWTEYGQVIAPSGDETTSEVGGIIREDATHWYMYYTYRTASQVLPGIRSATSSDGKTWSQVAGDVVHIGPTGTYDSRHIEGCQAFKIGSTYVLFYSCYDGTHYVSALASSSSPTSGFTKSSHNPVFIPSDVDGFWDHEQVSTAIITGINGHDYVFYQGTKSVGDYNYALWNMGVAKLGTPPTDSGITFFNSGFESPATGTYTYGPMTNGWVFEGNSGVQKNGSAFSGTILAPEGTQSGFLQTTGYIYQDINITAAGNYIIGFKAAQRNGNNNQSFDVYYDTTKIGTCTPLHSASFYSYNTGIFTASTGTCRIKFVGTNPLGGDNTALIDKVTLYYYGANHNADSDGDGMSDADEAIAGTDPHNAASCLVLYATTNNPSASGKFAVRWQSVSNKHYTVMATTNLMTVFTNLPPTNILATPSVNVYTDSVGNAKQRFYRVKVK